eukprot:6131449-Amphidinium_carterae.1
MKCFVACPRNALFSSVWGLRMGGPSGLAFRGFESTIFVLQKCPGKILDQGFAVKRMGNGHTSEGFAVEWVYGEALQVEMGVKKGLLKANMAIFQG